jgi:hypothetical protein
MWLGKRDMVHPGDTISIVWGEFAMEIMGKGFMIVPVIIFVLGIVVSAMGASTGVERIKDKK